MRSCETAVRYKSVGAPTTFVTHSSFTGTHGRYVKLETEDDATLPRVTHSSFTGAHGRYVKLETEDDATLPCLLRTFTLK